jgi:hypothetical protein
MYDVTERCNAMQDIYRRSGRFVRQERVRIGRHPFGYMDTLLGYRDSILTLYLYSMKEFKSKYY